MSQEAISAARALVNSNDYGILSTLSVKLGGFPFGSVAPYCLDGEGMPVVLISTIAQHTINITADSRCSITIMHHSTNVQAKGRLVFTGNMELVGEEEEAVAERYFRHFPDSRSYSQTHNFSFYRLRPISVRYIGGFGAIHWFEPEDVLSANPFHGAGEDRVVEHMNADHHSDLVLYCTHYKGMTISEQDSVRMVGIDAFGFDVFVNAQKVRFEFEEPAATAADARARMVALSVGAR